MLGEISWQNFDHAVVLHFMYYNFVRIYRTPAMAAEVTGQLACIEDIAKLASHGRLAFAEFAEAYRIESDFEAKVAAEFNKMVEKALCQQPV
ncbi:MAG: hypothetical protein AUK28_05240 [Desulfobacterales bacterium CG2_30_60_27]|nr:MAG: hypothetical protein AUK28_05240 [Desulfobacterales bacterium CG2_30_60_27]